MLTNTLLNSFSDEQLSDLAICWLIVFSDLSSVGEGISTFIGTFASVGIYFKIMDELVIFMVQIRVTAALTVNADIHCNSNLV